MANVTDVVKEKYGEAARRVLDAGADATSAPGCSPASSCCGGAAFNGSVDPITSNLYVNGERDVLPESAMLASLGCGNPTALATLNITATSLNPALITSGSLFVSGAGPSRTLAVTPVANQFGSASIQLVVSDVLATQDVLIHM